MSTNDQNDDLADADLPGDHGRALRLSVKLADKFLSLGGDPRAMSQSMVLVSAALYAGITDSDQAATFLRSCADEIDNGNWILPALNLTGRSQQ